MTKTSTKSSKTPIRTDDVLMTIKEVAHLDQTSERTVRRAIQAGLLEAMRIGPGGRSIRISRTAHAAYRRRLSGWP
jgi:excisionase family DNA binding protein